MRRSWMMTGAAAPAMLIACLLAVNPAKAKDGDHDGDDKRPTPSRCHLGNGIKHVYVLQFDNVHFRRDNPNVPSDLEQMPNLLNFIENNGTLLGNHHTPLISHTADDIITGLTGTYGEKHGQPVANSYGFFKADGTVGFSSSFAYWTDTAPDGAPQMVDPRGKIHPAPWVAFTRAGCDVGAFGTANIELENVTTDVDTVFGANSPEHQEAHALDTPTRHITNPKAVADFEGISIHCGQGSAICANGQTDALPDEPGGYVGFTALFGNKFIAPAINHGSPSVNDLNGAVIADGDGNVGFPGFDPTAAQTLGYAATMLEAGVQVVFTYISDAHDDNGGVPGSDGNFGSFGPGETGYVNRLAAYNDSFGKFFARLKADGITKENTLFVFTTDENDHFAGQAGAPAGCDGIHTPCNYIRIPAGCNGDPTPCTVTNLGEVTVNVDQLLVTPPFNNTTAFKVHSDDAPTVYIQGNPGQTDPVTRQLERDMAKLLAFDPIVNANVPLTQRLAGVAEMSLLHMVTHDPARTPTFTAFDNDDFFVQTSGNTPPTPCTSLVACSDEQPTDNWNHGDFQEDIVHNWAGLVGPGVLHLGVNNSFFTDHTDLRPTLLSLTGLKDDYAHDGRVVFEILDDEAVARTLSEHEGVLSVLASSYKAINAPVGTLGLSTLQISTTGLAGDDATFATVTQRLLNITARRNAIASRMIAILEGAAFAKQRVNVDEAEDLIEQAEELLESAK